MGLLADVFSYSDGLKRKAKGLLADPMGTIGLGMTRFGEDQNSLLNLQTNAYPMAGDKTVLNSPQQIAQFRGQLADKGAEQAMAAATVWHGSPHKFDKFDSSKIGTGEGAQAYGHGIYTAQSPDVAKGYIPKTAHNDTVRRFINELPEDAGFDDVMGLLGKGHFTAEQENVIKALHSEDWLGFDYPSQAISQAYRPNLKANFDPSQKLLDAVSNSGHLYKVDLPDEHITKMLDWDKPLSQQHPDVQAALANAEPNISDSASHINKFNGGLVDPFIDFLSNTYGGQAGASAALRKAGIPGIKYLDGGSRGAGIGSSNFVVFPGNESMLSIMERNGQPIGGLLK